MADQTLTAVVLPAGLAADGKLRANIYLSPRLSGAAQLSSFPDWLAWPDLIRQHGLEFSVACGASTATVAAGRGPLRPDVWREIFTPRTAVADYPQPDYDQRLLVSYPVRDAAAFVKYAYQFVASAGDDESGRLLETLLPELAFRRGDESTLDDVLSNLRVSMWQSQLGGNGSNGQPQVAVPAPGPAAGVQAALTRPGGTRPMIEQFALYHHLPPASNRPPLPHTPEEFARLLDFHKAVSALSAYPALLAALGLVFPVELPASFCPPSPSGGSYLTVAVSAVSPGWTWSVRPAVTSLQTSYVRNGQDFAAAPAAAPGGSQFPAADVAGGFLVLDPDSFQLVEIDLDGALLKAMSLADNVAFARTSIEPVLPSLRSAGISLIANGRAEQLLAAIKANKAFEAALASGQSSRPLNALDLVRGYRLDIWSARTSQWHSLHRRDGSYRFGAAADVAVNTTDEEGFTQLAVTQPADDPTRKTDPVAAAAGAPQPGTDLYVHERVARWNGWSLSAPRPGIPLNRSPDPDLAADQDPTVGSPVTPFKMTTTFAAHPGSLPQLRFGDRYQVRARTVDLAGHSVGLETSAPEPVVAPGAGATLPYLRFEPVGPPVLVLRTTPGPGGSHAQLVIRSHNTDPSLDAVPATEEDERHVAPPRASVLLAEHHGMLDDSRGYLRGDPAIYSMIIERDRGEFPTVNGTPIEAPSQLTVPYFPDPLARGAAFANLPNTPAGTRGTVAGGTLSYAAPPDVQPVAGSVTHIGFQAGWPDSRAFRVRLADGQSTPAWLDAERVLTVTLGKAESVTVGVSCYVDPSDLDVLGVWSWVLELYEAAQALALQQGSGTGIVQLTDELALLTRLVLDGVYGMITPQLDVTFVHAVQQPLGRPSWSRLPIVHHPEDPAAVPALSNAFWEITAWRYVGSHATVLLGALQINGKSTAAIDIDAAWTEWLDDTSEPAPTRTPAASHVDRIPLGSLDAGAIVADVAQQRTVAVYIPEIDTLWFAAPFDELQDVAPPGDVAAPVHQLGDTKHRCIQYRAVASSRFQEYFTEPGLVFTRTSAPIMVEVPSSARPLPPDIVYVVPTFGWERQESTNLKSEVRFGNGLRVYLNRPWYSSGQGELLGVVLWPESQPAPAPDDVAREKYKEFFTQWGLDPIWASDSLDPVPGIADFSAATFTATGLTLAETPLPVDVAGHEVAFDATRGLWYCDIELDAADAYQPFIRLALARYQPSSIGGVELSHVVLADFAQLTPTRSASLTVDPASPARARLVIGGPAPQGPTRSVVTVTVEEHAENIGTDLGWVPAPAGRVSVTEDSPPPLPSAAVLWSGTISSAARLGTGAFRVVIRESELIEIDPPASAPPAGPAYGERLIYASILPLDFLGH
ncbi:MAG: hypothetical protein WAK82_30860 [Streptosporangiaceae bacterium]